MFLFFHSFFYSLIFTSFHFIINQFYFFFTFQYYHFFSFHFIYFNPSLYSLIYFFMFNIYLPHTCTRNTLNVGIYSIFLTTYINYLHHMFAHFESFLRVPAYTCSTQSSRIFEQLYLMLPISSVHSKAAITKRSRSLQC